MLIHTLTTIQSFSKTKLFYLVHQSPPGRGSFQKGEQWGIATLPYLESQRYGRYAPID